MVRLVALTLALALAGACGGSDGSYDRAAAARVAVAALAQAGVDDGRVVGAVRRATVDTAPDGDEADVWMVPVRAGGRTYRLGVDRGRGRVVRLFEPAGSALTDAHVQRLASYRPSGDGGGSVGQVVAVTLLVMLTGAVAYGGLRAARLRAEARAASTDEIALDS